MFRKVFLSLVLLGFVTPAHAGVSKPGRRLLVVSTLETFGQAKYAWLYSFLDASTVSLAQASLGSQYASVSVLAKQYAKRPNFVNILRNLTNQSSVGAVDVILSLHGANNKVWFDDGSVTLESLKSDLTGIPKRSKLRLVYNLACYGATHRDELIGSGFRTAIGARKTNTASAAEYPAFLSRWAMGHAVNSILALTNVDPALAASDAAAGAMGFNDADSVKLISGRSTLTINDNAQ